MDPQTGEAVFPTIERLGPGEELRLAVNVLAKTHGTATCEVSLVHDELGNRQADPFGLHPHHSGGRCPRR